MSLKESGPHNALYVRGPHNAEHAPGQRNAQYARGTRSAQCGRDCPRALLANAGARRAADARGLHGRASSASVVVTTGSKTGGWSAVSPGLSGPRIWAGEPAVAARGQLGKRAQLLRGVGLNWSVCVVAYAHPQRIHT